MNENQTNRAIKLASGIEFECGIFLPTPEGNLYISVHLDDPLQIVQAFTNKAETREIIYEDRVFKGYTRFISFSQEGPSIYTVCLQKEISEEDEAI